MKMLQVLVCYLAITAQPFHPFVFAASSLASINRDGYANKTHMDGALIKQVLDSIVEACQTATMQKHGDIALMKHANVSGDILDARQEGPPPLPLTIAIGAMITFVALGVAWILEDNPVRAKDLEFLVDHMTRVFY